jgi:hypothetical protein
LQHLEVMDYCNAEQLPGCIMFLYFDEKAYDDRMNRGWLMQCMHRMGFPAQAQTEVGAAAAGWD